MTGDGLVWITGGGTGLGAALARLWAGRGAPCVVSGRRTGPLEAVCAAYPDLIRPHAVDVSDREAVFAAVARIEAAHGPIRTAVLNAGTHRPTPADGFDGALNERILSVNLHGVLHCLEALLPRMIARKEGRLLLVASLAGYRGLPSAATYCASKAAVNALAESLKFDLDGAGVDIRVVNPGFVKTPLTDLNDFPMPDIITADAAARHIDRGVNSGRFDISFPPRFAFLMKMLRAAPDRFYFTLMRRMTGA